MENYRVCCVHHLVVILSFVAHQLCLLCSCVGVTKCKSPAPRFVFTKNINVVNPAGVFNIKTFIHVYCKTVFLYISGEEVNLT